MANEMLGLTPEEMDIANKRRMAEMLRMQSMTPIQGQVVSGRYIAPSPFAQLGRLLSAYKGRQMEGQANEAAQNLAQQQQSSFGETAKQYMQALQGTPETTSAYQADNPFGENLGNLQTVTPARPGSQQDALLAALQSRNPQWQQFGMKTLERQALTGPGGKFGAIMPSSYTPESLAKFQASGNYGDLVPVQRGASFGTVNPGQFTPESLATYAQTGNYADLVARNAPQKIEAGNETILMDPSTGRIISRTPKQLAPSELPSVRGAQAMAVEQAKAGVKTTAEQAAKATQAQIDAESINTLATEAEKLLKKASSGKAEAAVSAGKRMIGISDEKTQADAALDVIAGQLVGKVPRFEGPQSDSDRLLYEKMSGRVGDPTVPASDRLAALKTMQRLNNKYAKTVGAPAPAARPTPVPQRPVAPAAPAVKFLGFE